MCGMPCAMFSSVPDTPVHHPEHTPCQECGVARTLVAYLMYFVYIHRTVCTVQTLSLPNLKLDSFAVPSEPSDLLSIETVTSQLFRYGLPASGLVGR